MLVEICFKEKIKIEILKLKEITIKIVILHKIQISHFQEIIRVSIQIIYLTS